MKKVYLNYFKQSLQNRIYVSFILLMVICTVILSIGSYLVSVKILKNKMTNSFTETLHYISNSIDKELKQVEQVSDFIFTNNQIKKVLIKNYQDMGLYLSDMSSIDDIFINYSISDIFRYIPAIKIFGMNGEEISYGNSVYENDSYRIKEFWNNVNVIETKDTIHWNGIHPNLTVIPSEVPYVISLFRVMKSTDYAEDIGLMYISLNPDVFGDMLNNVVLDNGSQIIIVDSYNRIIYSANSKMIYKNFNEVVGNHEILGKTGSFVWGENKGKKLVAYREIEPYGWRVYGIIPLQILTNDNKVIMKLMIPVFCIVLICASIIWYIVLSKITGPITVLSNTMNSVREGNTLVRIDYDGEDEVGLLGRNFNYMIERMHTLFNNLLEEQYKVLMAEINPHFLYNTLNSIRWMAIIQKADNIKEVIDVLSRLLMNSMKNAKQFVTIDEEVNNLKDYIYIQKLRYNDGFEVQFNIANDVLQYNCIKLMLQPMVENAIFHGIEPKGELGMIWVSIYKNENMIYFEVKDNGIGMSQSKIEEILYQRKEHKRGFSGIGVRNVAERIKMIYGEKYGVNIMSQEGEYTLIQMTIPVDTKVHQEDGQDNYMRRY